MRRPFFFVDGEARPQGSKSAPIAGVVRDSSRGLHAWREAIALTARAAGWTGAPADVPVMLGLVFVRPRPVSHLGKGGSVRETAPALPTSKPDIDKLERATLDALTGVCWVDDSRVVGVRKLKVYGDREGLGLYVLPLEGPHAVTPGTAELRDLRDTPASAVLAALSWWPTECRT